MPSAGEQQEVVSSYLDQELKANRIALQEKAQDLGMHVSQFEVIPKKGKPNKWTRSILTYRAKCKRWYFQRRLQPTIHLSWPGSR